MKTIKSKNYFYLDLHLLCKKIGKKCLDGIKYNSIKNIWHVIYDKVDEKITFEISYFKPDSEHTNIILTLCFKSGKKKSILINVNHIAKIFDEGYELPTVEYSIDNKFYSTLYCADEGKTTVENFI